MTLTLRALLCFRCSVCRFRRHALMADGLSWLRRR